MQFSKEIKQKRVNMGLSQKEMASLLHVSRSAISSWENNRSAPSSDKMKEIARILNLDFIDLLSDNTHNQSAINKHYSQTHICHLYILVSLLVFNTIRNIYILSADPLVFLPATKMSLLTIEVILIILLTTIWKRDIPSSIILILEMIGLVSESKTLGNNLYLSITGTLFLMLLLLLSKKETFNYIAIVLYFFSSAVLLFWENKIAAYTAFSQLFFHNILSCLIVIAVVLYAVLWQRKDRNCFHQ